MAARILHISASILLTERGEELRDVRSPTWSNSRDSGSEQSRVRSPSRRFRDGKESKSVSKWSKYSMGSEQPKSVEVRKREVEAEKGEQPNSVEFRKRETDEVPVERPKSVEVRKRETEEVQAEKGSRTSSKMEEGGAETEETRIRSETSDGGTDRVEEKGESLDKQEAREEKGESSDKQESQASQGIPNGQSVQEQQHRRHPEGSSEVTNGMERHLSFNKQLSGAGPVLSFLVPSAKVQNVPFLVQKHMFKINILRG
ncbi:hypothetical protein ACFXTI_039806 [Malus domestica]